MKRGVESGTNFSIKKGATIIGELFLLTTLVTGSSAPLKMVFQTQTDSPPPLKPYHYPEPKGPMGPNSNLDLNIHLIPPAFPPINKIIPQES